MPHSIAGSCSCGEVRFSTRTPSLFCGHCHCTMCRRNHGAGYVTWLIAARDRFSIDTGETALIRYPSSDHGTRSFCGRCGSSLFFASTEAPETIDVVRANLTGDLDREPQLHIYFDDRVDWIHVADDLPRIGDPADHQ